MDLTLVDRLFQQVLEGWDIPTPPGVLRVKREDAARTLPGLPYSMVKNLAHAVYWQNLWLGKLRGDKSPPSMEVWTNDWRDPGPEEWEGLRTSFVSGLEEARGYCGEGFCRHKCKSDEAAADTLIAIAIHASYHLGQLNVLKRSMRKGKES